jgi:tRNA nucleotidyltransferase (CCA-adding enzyme)
MTSEQELREKLRKISALFAGATTLGERDAAAAAIGRVQKALAAAVPAEPSVEMHFKFPDRWHRRLFIALCRRHRLEPYRYRGQRHTTVVVRAPDSFINTILWPEFLQIKDALNEYLNEATERIIREEVYSGSAEAAERTG